MDAPWEDTGRHMGICSWEMKTSLTTETETQIQTRTQLGILPHSLALALQKWRCCGPQFSLAWQEAVVNYLEMDAHRSWSFLKTGN